MVTSGMTCCCFSSGEGVNVTWSGAVCCCFAGMKVAGWECVSSCNSSGLGVFRFVSSGMGVLGVLLPSGSAVTVDDDVDAGELTFESSWMTSWSTGDSDLGTSGSNCCLMIGSWVTGESALSNSCWVLLVSWV